MDFKMYHFMCFILLLSLEGLKFVSNQNITTTLTSPKNDTNLTSPDVHNGSQSTEQDQVSTSSKLSTEHSTNLTATMNTSNGDKGKQDDCLFNLKNQKELLLWIIISLLCLICLLLLIIIMYMACKSCRSRNNNMVMLESSKPTRRNSVNGGPSETDVLLKDCSSVKVEMETIPAESEKPEEVGGADAEEVENQDSTEKNKNSADDTSETAPTQEANQSAETDLKTEAKMEGLENME